MFGFGVNFEYLMCCRIGCFVGQCLYMCVWFGIEEWWFMGGDLVFVFLCYCLLLGLDLVV